jgi:hypothetical protein
LYSTSLRTPILKSAELDTNYDGKMDRLEMSVQLPIAVNEKITSVTSLTYFNVQLNSAAKYFFDAVGYINYESGNPIGEVNIEGDLILRQTWPLSAYGG